MKRSAIFSCVLLLVALLSGAGVANDLTEAEIETRDKAFSKSMANCVLVGSFTIDG